VFRPGRRRKRTAQKPGRPTTFPGKYRCYGAPVIKLRRSARPREQVPAGKNKLAHQGRPKTRATGVEVEGVAGVGGLHRSEEVGEPQATGPSRAKAARVVKSFEGEP
jgi:hypothetical protein